MVEAGLTAGFLGRPVRFLERIDSTNRLAKELAAQGALSGTLVLADFQTRGRGRLARSWEAPAGSSLLLSLILKPEIPLRSAFRLTMAAAVALARAVEEETGLSPLIKWPNDLYLKGRKLAGILTEVKPRGEGLRWAVIGLGLNVSAHPPGLPAIDLEEAASAPVDRLKLLDRFLHRLEELYQAGLEAGPLREEWKKRSYSLGREVEVKDGEETVRGRALDIDGEGALLVRTARGARRVVSGDLSLVD